MTQMGTSLVAVGNLLHGHPPGEHPLNSGKAPLFRLKSPTFNSLILRCLRYLPFGTTGENGDNRDG